MTKGDVSFKINNVHDNSSNFSQWNQWSFIRLVLHEHVCLQNTSSKNLVIGALALNWQFSQSVHSAIDQLMVNIISVITTITTITIIKSDATRRQQQRMKQLGETTATLCDSILIPWCLISEYCDLNVSRYVLCVKGTLCWKLLDLSISNITPGNPFAYPGINITRPFCYFHEKCSFWLT